MTLRSMLFPYLRSLRVPSGSFLEGEVVLLDADLTAEVWNRHRRDSVLTADKLCGDRGVKIGAGSTTTRTKSLTF